MQGAHLARHKDIPGIDEHGLLLARGQEQRPRLRGAAELQGCERAAQCGDQLEARKLAQGLWAVGVDV